MTQNIIKFDPSKRKKSRPKPLENRLNLQPNLRIWRILSVVLILLAVGLLFFWGSDDNFDWSNPPSNAVTVSARDVRIIDGDTVEVAGEKLRLKGWDTPEKFGNEKCAKEKMLGEKASQYATTMLARSREFSFVRSGTDAFGRTLSHWSVDGADYGKQLQAAGLAKRWSFGLKAKPNWCGVQ